MASMIEALNFLRPEGGYIANGLEYEGIQFIECEPFTKAEFEAAFPAFDAWQAQQDSKTVADKAALLAKLGITADEARLLLS